MDGLQDALRQKERELATIRGRIKEASAKGGQVASRMDATREELEELLAALWPLHLKRQAGLSRPASAWTETDRRFTWMSALYDGADAKLAGLRDQSEELSRIVKEQEELKRQATVKLAAIQDDRDELLDDKLAFVRRIREVRAERASREEVLAGIQDTIEDLNYRLKLSRGGNIKDVKGRLPKPVDAPVAVGYGKSDGPAGRGVSFKLPENTPVKSVFWGKVVHDDVLRGFGRVVIVYHGDDYYSLYAYLSESLTALGREVEKGEPLGLSGFYPGVQGPGLYFELRFKQKAINPEDWLALR
jgi:septal ring factor EnvC (AmiA/AmiB activator)